MPGSGRPGVFEHGRDLAGGHRTAFKKDQHQDAAPYRMREGGEDGLVRILWRFRSRLRHANNLASMLNDVNHYLLVMPEIRMDRFSQVFLVLGQLSKNCKLPMQATQSS